MRVLWAVCVIIAVAYFGYMIYYYFQSRNCPIVCEDIPIVENGEIVGQQGGCYTKCSS